MDARAQRWVGLALVLLGLVIAGVVFAGGGRLGIGQVLLVLIGGALWAVGSLRPDRNG